jgi:putative chitinase
MNRRQLLQIAPLMGIARADTFLGPLRDSMTRYGIDTVARQAHFLAQILHESQNLAVMVENLNYKPSGLLATFNTLEIKRFSEEDAERLGRTDEHPANQREIALHAYNGRMGNKIDSEDGWRYRGRGPIQITGLYNVTRCGAAIGYDLVSSPELLQEPDVGCLSSGWYWDAGNPHGSSLNKYADVGDVGAITRAINGGKTGLLERYDLTKRALGVLGAA